MSDWKNQLYYGDCLEVLKNLYEKYSSGFIDLIYIDPPFNSKRNYNILFEDIKLTDTQAQKQAFADTWSNVSYKDTLEQIKTLDLDLFYLLDCFDKIRISKSAVAYLTMMAIRIWYMHKVLKTTGSFYLHCDSTVSHYLKIVCDLIFGHNNFRNEIIWLRSNPKSHISINFSTCTDTILRYTKTSKCIFHQPYEKHDPNYIKSTYRYVDEQGQYRLLPLLNPNDDRPNLTYKFLGIKRVWRWTKERMQKAYDEGLIVQLKPGAVPQYKKYLQDSKGRTLTNCWTDILQVAGNEFLGYPTQKPEALLERIILASSNEDDLVADPFCGCGTTITVSEQLKRRWLGVDISHLAIGLIEKRLIQSYGKKIRDTYEIHGFPKDLASAKELAHSEGGRLKFQDWIIESKLGGVHNPKRTADGGWDGHATFQMDKKKEIVLIEVKSGYTNVKNLREFIHVAESQKVSIGVFVCFAEQVTKPMQLEAKSQGYYNQEFFGTRYNKIQILTVEEILNGQEIQKPSSTQETFKQAQKNIEKEADQIKLI